MRRGYSLVELVLVMMILVVVTAIATPRFAGALQRHRLDGAARCIAADIELARRWAMSSSTPRTFQVDGATGYRIVDMPHPDHPGEIYIISLLEDCQGVESVSNDLGGDASLVLDIYGIPDTAAEIIIGLGGTQRTITVDADSGCVTVSG